MGYAICSNINKNITRVELHDILQSKFFSHLSIISRKLLNSFLHKNVKIQKTFLLAMDKKALGIGPLQTLTTYYVRHYQSINTLRLFRFR